MSIPPGLPEFPDKRLKIEPCGSRVTCDPCRPDADYDWLVQIMPDNDGPFDGSVSEQRICDIAEQLGNEGFVLEGSEHYQSVAANSFMSWRLGEHNLIVTANAAFAARHRAATACCKRLNLLNKPDRIALFQAVLYGAIWTETP